MSKFQILDERRFPLKTVDSADIAKMPTFWPGKNKGKDMSPFWRWEHRVTLGWGTREFMVFVDQIRQTIHIEEISGGHLEAVEDDSLFESLLNFAQTKQFCEIMMPIMKHSEERYI